MGTFPGRTSDRFRFPICFVFILLFNGIVVAQKPLLKQSVSLTVVNKPIAEVLDKLSNKCGLRFTYDPDDISAGRKVTLQVHNLPLSSVLSKVFGDNSLSFREKGDQIIIYRNRPVKEPRSDEQALKQETGNEDTRLAGNKDIKKDKSVKVKPESGGKPNPVTYPPDTVYLVHNDTVLVRDTLLQIDTLFMHDTIIIKKTEFLPPVKPVKKEHSFFAEFSGAYSLSTMAFPANGSENENLKSRIETIGVRNLPGNSAGIGIGYRFDGWAIRTGINYTRFLQKFNYTYAYQTGGYYQTDTIEKYYTLNGPDTAWFYITDSSWLEKQFHQYHYKDQNQFRYVEIPVSLSYGISRGNFDIYITGGAIAGILPSSVGSFIKPEPDYPITPLGDISLKTFILSLTGGVGAHLYLNDYAGIFTEVSYRQQLGSVYKNYPVSVNFKSVSFRIGLSIYF
jgi:hypothetical protein